MAGIEKWTISLPSPFLETAFINEKLKTKQNAKLQRTDPGTKDTGKFNIRGHVFPALCPKWIFIIPIILVGKNTLN